MPESFEAHYGTVVKALAKGWVVPFLGAGVNLCGRPDGEGWRLGHYLPSGAELAEYLAESYDLVQSKKYPATAVDDLVRVSQYLALTIGSGPLYEELHQIFDANYPPSPLHGFLAGLPRTLRDKGYPPRYQLIVTTNYDDALERAFQAADEPYDLVSYSVQERGKFLHWLPDGEARLIEEPNSYTELSLDERTVILKIHGAVDRINPEPERRDSYVITEDNYIEYLTHTEIASLVPVKLAAKLTRSHFLFLGYSMRDWNLRVILHRIWGEQQLSWPSWAIQLAPEEIECEFWRKRGVDILELRLEDYVGALDRHVAALPPVAVAA